MTTFFIGLVILIVGYFTYGMYIDKIFEPDENRVTPAHAQRDDVDFLPLGLTKNALIQLLNIAGTGPIFGAIQGALFGPIAFILIPIGNILAGAVHDYSISIISLRNKGAGLPRLARQFLGKFMYHLVNGFTALLLLLVGAVFVKSPADLFALVFGVTATGVAVFIFIYYILATLLPVDKIIGRFYPIFGALLILSSVAIFFGILLKGYHIPNLDITRINEHPDILPIFPLFFTTVACGLISGFHATQSPIVARTLENEKQGKRVFYGMMVLEGAIAMIWALAAMVIFRHGGSLDIVQYVSNPAAVVKDAATLVLGAGVGSLAVVGIIILPITSGDTAFRSLRMIVAEYIDLGQGPPKNRLLISIPLFIIGFALVFFVDFNILWRYFAWANQTVAAITLLVASSYLYENKKPYLVTLIPGIFLLYVTYAYILNAKIGFNLPWNISYIVGAILTLGTIYLFMRAVRKNEGHALKEG